VDDGRWRVEGQSGKSSKSGEEKCKREKVKIKIIFGKKLRSGLNQFPGSQRSLDSFSPGPKIVFQTDLQVLGDNRNHLPH
jgi:hypothetical protein